MATTLRPVPGLKPYYLAGSDGHVYTRSVPGRAGVWLLAPRRLKSGRKVSRGRRVERLVVNVVTESGRNRSFHVATIICLAFHGPCPGEGYEVCHNGGGPLDDTPGNVRWGTREENVADAIERGEFTRGKRVKSCP